MVQRWGAVEKSARITSCIPSSRRFVLPEGNLIINSMNIGVEVIRLWEEEKKKLEIVCIRTI